MPGRVLLDTSVLIGLLRGDPAIAAKLGEVEAVYTNVVALGELLYGARRSGRSEANRAVVERLAGDLTVLACDRGTASAYARLKDDLRVRGRPIPDNDLWVAASAEQHGLTLVARDEHFRELDRLDQVLW